MATKLRNSDAADANSRIEQFEEEAIA